MVGLHDVGRWTKRSRYGNTADKCNPKQLNIHVISDGITRLPILEGEISQIELPRLNSPLGLTIVGGADTPLRCIVIQEIFPDGFAAQDGRLQAGDQIIEVDGVDMTTATHQQVCDALRKPTAVSRLGIYRERIEAYTASPSPVSNYGRRIGFTEKILHITLKRESVRHLGVRLSNRRSEPGIFITDLMASSTAELDGRLRPQDRLLAINGEDIRYGRLDEASKLMQHSGDRVRLIISRVDQESCRKRLTSLSQDSLFGTEESDPMSAFSGSSSASDENSVCSAVEEEPLAFSDLSDNSRSSPSGLSSSMEVHLPKTSLEFQRVTESPESDSCSLEAFKHEPWKENRRESRFCSTIGVSPSASYTGTLDSLSQVFGWRKEVSNSLLQKQVNLNKVANEGLGMRIGGGLNSNEGDTPIYVANINSNGPAGKSRLIKKGDVVLSVGGQSLLGLTHSQAVSLMKSTAELTNVTLSLLDGPETSTGLTNFVPSWLYWQRLPRSLHISKSVLLHRCPGASLGFSIVGGRDPSKGQEPIHVLFVVATSPASADGRLRCGDRILAVDGTSLENVSHSVAVSLLKQAGTTVHLEVVSWLGTEV